MNQHQPHRSSSTRSQSRQQNCATSRASRSTSTRPDFQSNVHHEIEILCRDLLLRYRDATQIRPPMAGIIGEDPLQTATRLLKDSLLRWIRDLPILDSRQKLRPVGFLCRLRHFLDSLESFNWLTIHDRNLLYSSQVNYFKWNFHWEISSISINSFGLQVCSLAVLKASSSVKMDLVPIAYPLPYGENLEEVEALHLVSLVVLVAHKWNWFYDYFSGEKRFWPTIFTMNFAPCWASSKTCP